MSLREIPGYINKIFTHSVIFSFFLGKREKVLDVGRGMNDLSFFVAMNIVLLTD